MNEEIPADQFVAEDVPKVENNQENINTQEQKSFSKSDVMELAKELLKERDEIRERGARQKEIEDMEAVFIHKIEDNLKTSGIDMSGNVREAFDEFKKDIGDQYTNSELPKEFWEMPDKVRNEVGRFFFKKRVDHAQSNIMHDQRAQQEREDKLTGALMRVTKGDAYKDVEEIVQAEINNKLSFGNKLNITQLRKTMSHDEYVTLIEDRYQLMLEEQKKNAGLGEDKIKKPELDDQGRPILKFA